MIYGMGKDVRVDLEDGGGNYKSAKRFSSANNNICVDIHILAAKYALSGKPEKSFCSPGCVKYLNRQKAIFIYLPLKTDKLSPLFKVLQNHFCDFSVFLVFFFGEIRILSLTEIIDFQK